MTQLAKEVLRSAYGNVPVKKKKRRLAPLSEEKWEAMIHAIKTNTYPNAVYSPQNNIPSEQPRT